MAQNTLYLESAAILLVANVGTPETVTKAISSVIPDPIRSLVVFFIGYSFVFRKWLASEGFLTITAFIVSSEIVDFGDETGVSFAGWRQLVNLFQGVMNPRRSCCANRLREQSSVFAKELSPTLAKFHWQGGYGALSVSQSNLDEVIRYIENQEEHHKRVTFQDEYRSFLKAYGIEYDERYVWD